MKAFRPAAFLLAPCLALAAVASVRAQTDLTIAATGQASVPPDEATAALTVQAQEPTAAKAQALVNEGMTKALALSRSVSGVKVTTGGYNSYTVTPDNNAPQQYAAQQTINLSILAPAGAPPASFSNLLGTLQQNGLLLNSLSGDLSDAGQRQAQQAAITDSLTQIQAQAASIAATLHEQLGPITSLNVNAAPSPGPQPMMMNAMRASAPPPQSAPDNIQITASVTAVITLTRAP